MFKATKSAYLAQNIVIKNANFQSLQNANILKNYWCTCGRYCNNANESSVCFLYYY